MSESPDSGEEFDAIHDEHLERAVHSSEESSDEQELNQSFELREQERARHLQEMSTIEHEYAQLKKRLSVMRRDKIELQIMELQQGDLLELKEAILEYEAEYKKQLEVAGLRRQYRLAQVEAGLQSELQRAEEDHINKRGLAVDARVEVLRIRKMKLKEKKEMMDMPAPSPERTVVRSKQARNRGPPIWDGSIQSKATNGQAYGNAYSSFLAAPGPAPANFRRPSLSTGLMSSPSGATGFGGGGFAQNPYGTQHLNSAVPSSMSAFSSVSGDRRGSAMAETAMKKKPRTSIWTGPYVVYMLGNEEIEDDLRRMMYGSGSSSSSNGAYFPSGMGYAGAENTSLKRKAR